MKDNKSAPLYSWQDRLKGHLLRSVVQLMALLPLSVVRRLGAGLGWLMWRFNLGPACITRTNIRRCFPELNYHEQEQLILKSLRETAVTYLELGAAWSWPVHRCLDQIKRVTGQHYLDNAIAQRRGIVFLGPHLGNWELTGLYLSCYHQMATLYRPPRIKSIEKFMQKVRGRAGSELVPTNKRGVVRLFQILNERGVVGILPDQDPDEGAGVYAPFFGISTHSIRLVSRLLQKTDAVALCVFCRRLPGNEGFELIYHPCHEDIYATDINRSVAGLNASVEACVRQAPVQYQWDYKRFKSRPDGEGNFYPC